MTALTDTLARPLRDLRISVTDRCNFRCTYCMPKEVFGHDFVFLRREQLLSFEEIERLARLFLAAGVTKIRLTGGEPLLRRDLERLVSMLSGLRPHGLTDLTFASNAGEHHAATREFHAILRRSRPEPRTFNAHITGLGILA